ALRRRIQRDARGLTPSIELPWSPPFGDDLDPALVDLMADVLVLQADVADERTWGDDAAQRRTRAVDASTSIAVRADALSLRATAHALREIAASMRAWDALAPRR
ncbi:hypothetical protein, partial [Burkholderia cenocepacia]|uniref:hypothetical protein n=1 Tax=Burkholderia cenocepacia TaxID=95486 RepID=UPI0038CC18ED